MYDIITFGSASRDIMVKPKNLTVLKYNKEGSLNSGQEVCFPMGSKIAVDQITFTSGGGGTNTAATFALQGFKTAFLGIVGKDTSGKEVIEELKSLNINTSLVAMTSEKLTNHSVVILGDGQNSTLLTYRGASELLGKDDIPFKKIKTRWLYLAPLSGVLGDSFEDLVNFASENNIKIAVNPGIAQLSLPKEKLQAIFNKVAVLILNQEEASFLTKIPYHDTQEIVKALKEMCKGVIIMTKGGDGVMVSHGNDVYSALPHPERKVVDTTGAGDAFGAGFVSEFIRSTDIEKAIQLGMANSVGCVGEIGAKSGLLKKGQEFNKVTVQKNTI